MERSIRMVAAVLVALSLSLGAVDLLLTPLPSTLMFGARWAAILALAVYALRKRSLTVWIMVAMVAGAAIGYDFPHAALSLQPVATIFLRLIKTIVAPLLFATLVSGIAAHSDLKRVGRMGVKAIVYFEIVTTFALAIGLAAINLSKAGVGVHVPAASAATNQNLPAQKLTAAETIVHIFPENIAKSIAEGQVLQVVIFSMMFGMALAMVREDKRQPMLRLAESLAETMFKFTNIVMYFAPLGVAAALAYTVAGTGIGVLVNLAKLLATLYAALAVFVGCVLLPVALIARVPLRRFIAAVAEPVSIAFGTSSSEAALPRAMEAMEGLGVPREVVAFVMPTGYSFNMDGGTLYLSLAAIFVAQAAGIHLSLGRQLLLMLTLMLTSKGVAGVSRAAIVILLGTVASFGLPSEPVFILLGIDPLMDMARTAINVLGNCLATVVVARWEGDFPARRAPQKGRFGVNSLNRVEIQKLLPGWNSAMGGSISDIRSLLHVKVVAKAGHEHRVFITGATGYIGSHLIPLLIERGHRVRALVRPGSRGKLAPGCEVVTGDALDAGTYRHLVRPSDTFVHLVGVPHPSPSKGAEFRAIDLVAGREAIHAAAELGLRHFIYLSVAHPGAHDEGLHRRPRGVRRDDPGMWPQRNHSAAVVCARPRT